MPQRAAEIATALASWWRAGPADVEVLGAAIEAMPVGIVVTEAGGGAPPTILAWNPAYAELVGWEPKGNEPMSAVPYRIYRADRTTPIPPEELPGPRAALTGAPVNHVVTHTLRADGSWRVVAVSGSPLPGAGGTGRRRAVAVLLDITATRELEELRARTEALGAHVRDALFLIRRTDARILELNDAAVRMYGRPREDLLRMHVHELRADGDPAATARIAAAADRQGVLTEVLHRRGDGSTFTAEISARGEAVGGERIMVASVRDVTERVLAEQALREREARFRAFVENLGDVILTLDPDLTITYASPAVTALAGLGPEQVAGRNGAGFVHPEDLPRVRAALGACIEARAEVRAEYRSLHADGSWRQVEGTARNLLDVPGVRALVVTLRDVTAQRALEARARAAHRALVTLSRCNEALVRATAEQELLEAVCRIIVEEGGYRMCWVGLLAQDARRSVRPVAWAGHEDGYLSFVDVTWADRDARSQGPTGTAARTGRPVVGRDFATDASLRPWASEALRRGYRCSSAVPLVAEGRIFGVLTMYATEPDAFAGDELAFLRQLAEDLAFGVGALRARAERAAAEERLRRSREELRALAARLDAVREEEKSRIARDLHDEMGQILTGLRVDLDHLEERLAELPPGPLTAGLVDRAVDASSLVSRAISAMRNALSVLRPASLDRLGLSAALRQECREFEERTGLGCTVQLPETVEVTGDAETALYRIAQEALTNVARHARARRVSVSLAGEGASLVLRVADDGRGPTPDPARRGLGIVGMRERAERLGGELAVGPGEDGGTLVVARIPAPGGSAGGRP